jgi:hypothetical protein
MPAHHGLRSDDHQRLPPSGPGRLQHDPEKAVPSSDPGSAHGSREHSQLTAKCQVLQPQSGAIAGRSKPPEEKHDQRADQGKAPCLRNVENQQLPPRRSFQHPQRVQSSSTRGVWRAPPSSSGPQPYWAFTAPWCGANIAISFVRSLTVESRDRQVPRPKSSTSLLRSRRATHDSALRESRANSPCTVSTRQTISEVAPDAAGCPDSTVAVRCRLHPKKQNRVSETRHGRRKRRH